MEEEEEDDAHPDEAAVASLENLGEDDEGIEEISGNEGEGDEGELQEEEEGVCVCVCVLKYLNGPIICIIYLYYNIYLFTLGCYFRPCCCLLLIQFFQSVEMCCVIK